MLKGKTLQELAIEIERQQTTKRDFIADSRAITVLPPYKERTTLQLEIEGQDQTFGLRPTFHDQLAGFTKIPKPYYDRMVNEAPVLLATNANHWLHSQREQRLARTLDGDARALLSGRFRPLDHPDTLAATMPAFAEHPGLKVLSCEVTERRMYLQVASPRLEGEVSVGDVVQMGITVSNSEIGQGRLIVEGLLYRLRCKNGMVTGDGFRRAHLGRKADGISDGAEEFFKDDTLRLSDAALFAQVRDVVSGLLTEGAFQQTLSRAREAAQVKIESDIATTVEITRKRIGLSGEEGSAMLRHLIEGGDLSKWGLANSVTRLAHDAANYDRAYDLERAGARVIEMAPAEWKEIQKLAA